MQIRGIFIKQGSHLVHSFITAFLLLFSLLVSAQPDTVTISSDSGPGSLRQVIANASFGDTIVFADSLNGQAIVLTSQLSFSDKDLLFIGNGADSTIIDGGPGLYRLFDIPSGDAEFRGITFQQGGGPMTNVWGGAIIGHDSLRVVDCVFNDNTAERGGAIQMNETGTYLEVLRCEFNNNTAIQDGGAIYIHEDGSLKIDNCLFDGNQADLTGGAISTVGEELRIGQSDFLNNTSATKGGAIFNEITSPTDSFLAVNCLFHHDTASQHGSAIYINYLGNIGIVPSNIRNCTFSKNHTPNGTIFLVLQESITQPPTTTLSIHNSILWDNQGGAIEGDNIAVDHSIVQGGFGGVGNLDVDPQFVSTGDFRLQLGSPAINGGSNGAWDSVQLAAALDLDGIRRLRNDTVDMGAYEGLVCPGSGDILFVDSSKSIQGDGASWMTAFLHPQEAMDLSCDCSQNADIWIAKGTYAPTKINPVTLGATTIRDQTFFINKPMRLFGGFAGTESTLGQRNLDLHQTILSGLITPTDTAYHVMYMRADSIDENWMLNGLTIRDGKANGSGAARTNGGGLYIERTPSPVNPGDLAPVIRHCTFRNNFAVIGGGLYMQSRGGTDAVIAPTIDSTLFTENTGEIGSSLNFEAFLSPLSKTASRISYCTFTGDSARITNISLNAETVAADVFAYCRFENNKARTTAVTITTDSSNIFFENSNFSNNKDAKQALLLQTSKGISKLSNCLFAGNTGSGLELKAFFPGLTYSNVIISNTTFSNNTGAFLTRKRGTSIFDNCIFWGNKTSGSVASADIALGVNDATAELTNCLISPDGVGGTGMITFQDTLMRDPMFVDTAMGDYRLLSGSPAINQGLNEAVRSTTDLDGKGRILGPKVDMGAYESGDPCDQQNQFLDPNHFVAGENGYFPTQQSVLATNTIQLGADITYDGAGGVCLDPGFEVQGGAMFLARTVGCWVIN